MTFQLTSDQTTAVDKDYHWQPLESAPRGVKVQLLTIGRVAVYGNLMEANRKDFLAWAPCPKEPDWLKQR